MTTTAETNGAFEKQVSRSHDNNARIITDFEVDKIKVDWSLNVRNGGQELDPNDKDIQELAADIGDPKGPGLMHNLVVQERITPPSAENKRGSVEYVLAAGFRRYTAVAKILKWKKVAVKCIDGDELDAKMANIKENLARQDIKPHELAARCVDLKKEYNLTGKQIADRINFSKGYVNNLIRCAESLHPTILAAFRREKHGDTENVQTFYKLAKFKDQEEQLKKWEGYKTKKAEAAEVISEDEGDSKKKKKKAKKEEEGAKPIRAQKLIELFSDVKKSPTIRMPVDGRVTDRPLKDNERAVLLRVMQYVVGQLLTNPLMTEEEREAAKEEEKAALAEKAEKAQKRKGKAA